MLALSLEGVADSDLPGYKAGASAEQRDIAEPCGQSVAGERGKVSDLARCDGVLMSICHYAFGEWMLGSLLECVGQLQKFIACAAVCGDHIGDDGRTGGDGACLVKGYRIDAPDGLKRGCSLVEYAVLCSDTAADHDGDGSGEPESAWAGDDKH